MITSAMAPACRVVVEARGKDKLEARTPAGGLLGTAERRYGRREEDWIGWLVHVAARWQVVDTVTEARQLLEVWASEAVSV